MIMEEFQELSTAPINIYINNNINNKQTNIREISKQAFSSPKKEQRLKQLLGLWKLNEKNAGTFISKNNQELSLYDLKQALLNRIQLISGELLTYGDKVNPELASVKEKFYQSAFATLELCELKSEGYTLPELINKVLEGIEKYLKGE